MHMYYIYSYILKCQGQGTQKKLKNFYTKET